MRRRLLALLLGTAVLAPHAQAADAGQYTKHSYSNAKGTLTYTLFTPSRRATNLMVVLPGAGETSDDAATRSRFNIVAQQHGFVVAYPQQNPAYNSGLEWDWQTASTQGRANREASLIAGITQTVLASQGLRRAFVMGISAGAGMAGAMVAAFPELWSGLGIEAGCPFDNVGCGGGSVTADQSAAALVKAMGSQARRMPVFNEYGSADPIAVGVSSDWVVPSWLTVDDILDDGTDNGSVSRNPASDQLVVPAAPAKPYRDSVYRDAQGCDLAQNWLVYGESHAWSGGAQTGPSDTSSDPLAPDASTAMYRFFVAPTTLGASQHCHR